jgi:hypothetical protein
MDHGKLYRATCRDDAVIYDHATCSQLVNFIDGPAAFAAINEHYGRSMPGLIDRLSQTLVPEEQT